MLKLHCENVDSCIIWVVVLPVPPALEDCPDASLSQREYKVDPWKLVPTRPPTLDSPVTGPAE